MQCAHCVSLHEFPINIFHLGYPRYLDSACCAFTQVAKLHIHLRLFTPSFVPALRICASNDTFSRIPPFLYSVATDNPTPPPQHGKYPPPSPYPPFLPASAHPDPIPSPGPVVPTAAACSRTLLRIRLGAAASYISGVVSWRSMCSQRAGRKCTRWG